MYSYEQHFVLWSLLVVAAVSAAQQENTLFPPVSWPQISICIWLAYTVLRQGDYDRRSVLWGWASAGAMLAFLMDDSSFRSWGESSMVVVWQSGFCCI